MGCLHPVVGANNIISHPSSRRHDSRRPNAHSNWQQYVDNAVRYILRCWNQCQFWSIRHERSALRETYSYQHCRRPRFSRRGKLDAGRCSRNGLRSIGLKKGRIKTLDKFSYARTIVVISGSFYAIISNCYMHGGRGLIFLAIDTKFEMR